MMFRIRAFVVALSLFGSALALPVSAAADTVRLDNGDVLSGTILGLNDGTLVLKTDYAGEISIEEEHIVGIESAEPFTVRWDDGSERVGRLTDTTGGETEVSPPLSPAAEAPAEPAKPVQAPAEPPATTVVAEAEDAAEDAEDAAEDVEKKAAAVLAEAKPTEEKADELVDARELAADATLAAREHAAEEGKPGVAADAGVVNLSEVAWIRPLEPYYRYEGSFNVGFNAARGNANTTDVHIDGKIVPSFGRNTIAIGGDLNRSEADGQTNQSNWTVRAEYSRDFGVQRRWYANVFNSYENNDLGDLNLRVTAGAGVGYRFFNERPTLLSISLGPGYVNENYRTEGDRTFLGLVWNLSFERDLWGEDLVFYHTDTLTFGLTEDQLVARTATGLKVALIADLTASAELRYDHQKAPPPGAVKDDWYYILKIGYEFGGDENDWFPQW